MSTLAIDKKQDPHYWFSLIWGEPSDKPNRNPGLLFGCKNGRPLFNAEVAKRVASHLRQATGHNLPVNYLRDTTLPDEEKVRVLRNIVDKLVNNRLDELNGGIANGDRRVDPLEGGIAPANHPFPEPEPTPEPAPISDVAPNTPVEMESEPVNRNLQSTQDPAALFQQMARFMEPFIQSRRQVDADQMQRTIDSALAEFERGKLPERIKEGVSKAMSNGGFPEARVKQCIDEALAKHTRRIEIVTPDGNVRDVKGLSHRQLPQLIAWLNADVPIWVWGAAGAGKSHLFYQLADALELTGRLLPCDETLTVAKLVGYKNLVNGEFVDGLLVPSYREGGIQGFDEIDACAPAIACINSLIANDRYHFPSGETVPKHKSWRTIAFANTKGTGPVAGYTARTRLDAATLDRFAVIELKYDESLECAIATGQSKDTGDKEWQPVAPASPEFCRKWVDWVQAVRKAAGNSVLISPRASYNGVRALRGGIPAAEVAEAIVFKLCTDDTRQRLIQSAGPVPTE